MNGIGGRHTPSLTALVFVLALAAPAAALEQPTPLTAEDLRIGADMTPVEAEEATIFCQHTLAQAATPAGEIGRTCTCFDEAWAVRTNRLLRLVLPIVEAPDAPDARRNLALIFRSQDGIHENRLQQLAAQYQAAAKQAFRACR